VILFLLLNILAQAYRHPTTDKKYWVCTAKGCRAIYAGNLNRNRVILHTASECKAISAHLKKEANNALVAIGEKSLPISEPLSKEQKTNNEASASINGTAPSHVAQTWFNKAVQQGYEDMQSKTDSAIVLLICVEGMSPAMTDGNIWKRFTVNLI